MAMEGSQIKPRGFNVLTRFVYVHAAFYLAVLIPSLFHEGSPGLQEWPTADVSRLLAGLGIVIVVVGCSAMFGVAKRRSLKALLVLRGLLWISVVKVLAELLLLLAGRPVATASSLPMGLMNELALVALAIYWSRPVHVRYLASLAKI